MKKDYYQSYSNLRTIFFDSKGCIVINVQVMVEA